MKTTETKAIIAIVCGGLFLLTAHNNPANAAGLACETKNRQIKDLDADGNKIKYEFKITDIHDPAFGKEWKIVSKKYLWTVNKGIIRKVFSVKATWPGNDKKKLNVSVVYLPYERFKTNARRVSVNKTHRNRIKKGLGGDLGLTIAAMIRYKLKHKVTGETRIVDKPTNPSAIEVSAHFGCWVKWKRQITRRERKIIGVLKEGKKADGTKGGGSQLIG